MKVQSKKKIASILFVLISIVCVAQQGPPPPDERRAPLPPGGPIDGAIPAMVALAVLYGAKRKLKK